jgi:hypothetical protein
VLFSFTLRRADNVEWGLDVEKFFIDGDEDRQVLLVNAVQPGGAIEAWNRQVQSQGPQGQGGPKADKAVLVGDLIVGVNRKHSFKAMVDESENSMLLRLEVLRRGSDIQRRTVAI